MKCKHIIKILIFNALVKKTSNYVNKNPFLSKNQLKSAFFVCF